MRFIAGLILALLCSSTHASCVILLHGLWRSPSSLEKLEQRLIEEGYTTINLGYPSRSDTVEVLAKQAIQPALEKCPPEEDLFFVTHSLGGILVRQYLSEHIIENLQRVVMLGPPNQGSEVVDTLSPLWGFEWFNGPAGIQLGTAEDAVPNKLGAVNFDLGIIAGNRSINWILSSMIPGPDDGKVAIEKTKVEGMTAHITLPVNHATMMSKPEVIEQVVAYLKYGNWRRLE